MKPRLLVVSVAALHDPHRRAYDVAARLLGWDVHIAAPESLPFVPGKPPTRLVPAPKTAHYELHPLRHHFYRQQRMHVYRGLERLIARLRPNYVFVEYDPGSLPVLQAKLPPLGQKVIAFTVENIARERYGDAAEAFRKRQPRALARDLFVGSMISAGWALADGLACISEEGKRVFEQQGWGKPIEVVPLGTDMNAFRAGDESALRAELGLADKFVFGYFGRLVPEKGVDFMIEALAKTGSEVALLLDMYTNFAPGSYADKLMRRADELGVRGRIRTIDVPHAEVPRYMRCCDVIALPSLTTDRWKEQFGRVLPEAMACEVPVIGSRSGNIPSMIGDAGLLFEEGDAKALANAVEKLRRDPKRAQALGRAGRERVAQRFSQEAQARALQRLVAQL